MQGTLLLPTPSTQEFLSQAMLALSVLTAGSLTYGSRWLSHAVIVFRNRTPTAAVAVSNGKAKQHLTSWGHLMGGQGRPPSPFKSNTGTTCM